MFSLYDLSIPEGWDNKSDRPKFYYDIVKKYLEHHNIEFIISGHQDVHSISIMPNLDYLLDSTNKKHKSTNEYKKQFPIDNDNTQILKYDIDQYLITHPFGKYGNLNKDEYNFTLTKDDFIALVLSTAVTFFKHNNYHSYVNLKLQK